MASSTANRNDRLGQFTPLGVVSLFVSLTEVTLGVVAGKTSGGVQVALTCFVIGFPILIASAFFAVLWKKPFVFYPPSAYGSTKIKDYVEAIRGEIKTSTTKTSDLTKNVKVYGNPDQFQLLFKASGETWSKSTKAMQLPGGCLVQVSTEFMDLSGGWSVAEALSFVPAVYIEQDTDGNGRTLMQSQVRST